MNQGSQILLLLTLAGIAVAVHLVARYRPGRLMLVRVPDAERHRRRSRRTIAVNAALALAAAAAIGFAPDPSGRIQLLAWFTALVVPPSWILFELHRALRGRELASVPSRFHVWLERSPSFASYLSPPLQLLNAIALLAPLVVLAAWRVSLWPSAALFVPLILFVTALAMSAAWMQTRGRWVLPDTDKKRYVALEIERRQRSVRLLETGLLGWNLAGGLIWVSVAAGSAGPGYFGAAVAVVIGLLGVVVPLATQLPRLARIADQLAELAGAESLGTRTEGWRLHGFVYFSKADPALFVPKRNGLGQTLNFGRRAAWLLVAGVLLVPPAITALALRAARF